MRSLLGTLATLLGRTERVLGLGVHLLIGEPAVAWAFGPDTMQRFVYYTPRSFFHIGRLHRDQLIEAHGRLDPLIAAVIRDEMREGWWRYLLVSLPLAWCGMWVGGILGLALVPLFAWASIAAVRRSRPLFLIYAAPAVAMLGLHAAVANHYTRYNLILIGPFSAGAAWLLASVGASVRRRRREPLPEGDRNFELTASEMEKR